MTRKDEIKALLSSADKNERELVDGLIDEMLFLEQRMQELKKEPFIVHHPKKRELTKATPAAKQYKECSQSYINAVRVLLSVLRKSDVSAQDELLEKLKGYELA